MTTDHHEQLRHINTFPSLVRFLRDELEWPIDTDDFEDLTFDYTPEELRIDPGSAAKIQEIKRLRPLVANQPWGVFFVKFEPKQLPVVALRRILNGVVLKKRAAGVAADQVKWPTEDLLFISNYGVGDQRRISFAHFSHDAAKGDLPTLKVLAWDELDTPLHIEYTAETLVERLVWPNSEDEWNDEAWRERWSSAFELEYRETIATSKALAIALAALARRIRQRVRSVLEIETDDGPVTQLMNAFRVALVHDLNEDDFADMYAQTIAYGLLSARLSDPGAERTSDLAAHIHTSPFLRDLMQSFLKVGGEDAPSVDFDELSVSDVVALLDRANMDAVIRDFGDKNPLEDPVIHFYESFLKEYDAKKRLQRGVFYTPRPVVSYIVRTADELLRTEFGLEDGLADTTTWGEMVARCVGLQIPEGVDSKQPFVQILDPATGTGTFLVEVIDLIHRRMGAKWRSERKGEDVQGLWNDYVAEHLLPRLHGYELLMAPYAIAHLKVGLKLYETGYRFGSDERARIYLTNALEPAQDFSGQLDFAIPALAHEAQAVNEVKRERRFTVVIGNPPYSVYSSNDIPAIRSLMNDYKQIDGIALNEVRIAPLMDDYCKFYRFADNQVSLSNSGIIGLITNHGFLTGPVFRGMRHSLMTRYSISVLDLHGNLFRGDPGRGDTNVFEIKPGVCISLIRRTPSSSQEQLQYSEIRGSFDEKLRRLSATERIFGKAVVPTPPLYLWTGASSGDDEYNVYLSIADVFSLGTLGMMTGKDHFMIAWSQKEMEDRIRRLADRKIPDQTMRSEFDLEDSRDGCSRKRARRGLIPFLSSQSIIDRSMCVGRTTIEIVTQARSFGSMNLCVAARTSRFASHVSLHLCRSNIAS